MTGVTPEVGSFPRGDICASQGLGCLAPPEEDICLHHLGLGGTGLGCWGHILELCPDSDGNPSPDLKEDSWHDPI